MAMTEQFELSDGFLFEGDKNLHPAPQDERVPMKKDEDQSTQERSFQEHSFEVVEAFGIERQWWEEDTSSEDVHTNLQESASLQNLESSESSESLKSLKSLESLESSESSELSELPRSSEPSTSYELSASAAPSELSELPGSSEGSSEILSLEPEHVSGPSEPQQSCDESSSPTAESEPFDFATIARLIPNKMAFKIGDVAEITGLKTHILRYWESEFEHLSPKKSPFKQRMYTRRDVETVFLIKHLLYKQKHSIADARKKVKDLRLQIKAEKQIDEYNARFDRLEARVVELLEDVGRIRSILG
jgi:DNA-binding transcriptional MerR regulator